MLTDEQTKKIRRDADLATTCLTVVTIHVKHRDGTSFTVVAMPWDWLETARHLSRLRDVERMFATHTSVGSECWWGWKREEVKQARPRLRKTSERRPEP